MIKFIRHRAGPAFRFDRQCAWYNGPRRVT